MARHESEARTTPPPADRAASLLAASQAIDWQFRLRKPTPAIQQAYLEWLQASPVNVRETLLLTTTENDLRLLSLIKSRRTREAVDFSSLQPAWRQPLSAFKHTLVYASIAVLAMIVTWQFVQPASSMANVLEEKPFITFALADGSSVIAGPDSRVRISLGESTRDVVIESGEATFHVASDEARPFNVLVDQLMVRTDGGKFAIRRRGQWASVIVIEGNVLARSVDADSDHIGALMAKRLEKGQSLSISDPQRVRERRWIRAALVMDSPR